MSTLKADTIQNTSGGAATLTKQSAAKHFITYDNSQTITDSFNNSSITDVGTGNHNYAFTNAILPLLRGIPVVLSYGLEYLTNWVLMFIRYNL